MGINNETSNDFIKLVIARCGMGLGLQASIQGFIQIQTIKSFEDHNRLTKKEL